MKEFKDSVLLTVGIVGALLIAVGIFSHVFAQKAERGTTQWNVQISDWGGSNAVHIVDTTGVCLYIVSWGNDGSPAIAAIPKVQLPQGAGCQ
jgi:hypothetical protein